MRKDPIKWLVEAILKTVPKSNKPSPDPSRRKKYPYNFAAKVAHFPWMFYVKNNWVYRHYFVSFLLCIPAFMKIRKGAHSPNNVAKWDQMKAKEREEIEEH